MFSLKSFKNLALACALLTATGQQAEANPGSPMPALVKCKWSLAIVVAFLVGRCFPSRYGMQRVCRNLGRILNENGALLLGRVTAGIAAAATAHKEILPPKAFKDVVVGAIRGFELGTLPPPAMTLHQEEALRANHLAIQAHTAVTDAFTSNGQVAASASLEDARARLTLSNISFPLKKALAEAGRSATWKDWFLNFIR